MLPGVLDRGFSLGGSIVSALLPPNATELAHLLADVRADAVNLPVFINTLKNPQTIPAHLLAYLAWELSVETWNEEWPEHRKRKVVGEAIRFHRIKGTLRAVEMSLGYVDAILARAHTPSQGFYADPAASAEARAAWVETLPEIRIFESQRRIAHELPHRYVGLNMVARDDAVLARRAVLVRDGVETPLRILRQLDDTLGREKIILPVQRRPALIAGRPGDRTAVPADIGLHVLAINLGPSGGDPVRPVATLGDPGAFVASRRKLDVVEVAPFTPVGEGGRKIGGAGGVGGNLPITSVQRYGGAASRARPVKCGRRELRVARPHHTANYLVDWSSASPCHQAPRGALGGVPIRPEPEAAHERDRGGASRSRSFLHLTVGDSPAHICRYQRPPQGPALR